MALIASYTPSVAGTPPTFAAAAAGDTAECAEGMVLIVKNGSGASITATLTTPGNLGTGDAYPDKAYTVAAGTEVWIPLLDLYRDPTTRQAAISYSATASVTRAVVRF